MARMAKKPPSRVRYEAANPTVSCRVPKEVYDRLRAVMEAEGKSFADILKVGLGIQEAQAKDADKLFEEACVGTYTMGYEQAEELYRVTYPCSVCHRPIEVTSTNTKQAIQRYMQEHGWGHRECHRRRAANARASDLPEPPPRVQLVVRSGHAFGPEPR